MDGKTSLPPIVEQLSPSDDQIQAILSRGSDIVVTAGAGTGKTRTLVARYLAMLAEGLPLRSIVAITFTKKAAREMRNRVREEIRTYLETLDYDEPEYVFWGQIYQELDSARISTIHSLAADLIRQHPAELKLDPKFVLIDEGEAARLKNQAVEFALNISAQSEQSAQLFLELGEWKLRRMLREMLDKYLDLQDILFPPGQEIWSLWEPHLIQPIKEFIEHPLVESGLNGLQTVVDGEIIKKAESAGDLLAGDLRIVVDCWKSISAAKATGNWMEISGQLGLLREHLKQKGKKENWAPSDPKAIIKQLQPLYDDFLPSGKLNLTVDYKLADQIIPAMLSIFDIAVDYYQKSKERIYGLDFDDLEEKALYLLKEFPEAAEYWQGQVQILLVDEYQDTNNRQRELVNLLNAGNDKLFIVGDGKQSIYRFRGADVAVFRQEQQRIAEKGECFELSTSYRAHPELLNSLNRILESVLGREMDIPYLEPFAGLQAGRVNPKWELQPYIELHLALGTKTDGAMIIAADAIAARVYQLVNTPISAATKHSRSISYGDIVVLCRAASSFTAYEAAFEKAGIPYLTIAGQGFFNRPEIRDLLNLLQAVQDPHDDLALIGMFRSPGFGLTDADLYALRNYQLESGISNLLNAARDFQFSDNSEKISQMTKILGLYDDLLSLKGRVLVADLLGEYINRTGYLAALAGLGLERSIQNIRKLIDDAQSSGLTNISDFLVMVLELRNVSVREGEAQMLSEGAVQIMTVHQAKGLEFPVVILGDATKEGRSGNGILLDQKFGLILPFQEELVKISADNTLDRQSISSFAYQIAQEQEKLREEAESDRLLYVAATRAEELLIINGVMGKLTKDQTLGKLSGWLGRIADVLGLAGIKLPLEVDGKSSHQLALNHDGLEASLRVYELGVDLDLPAPSIELEIETAFDSWHEVVFDSQPVFESKKYPINRIVSPSDRKKAPAWVVGQVVHRALELWKFPSQGEADFVQWADSELIKQGLFTENEIQDGYRRAAAILERFCDHDLFQRMSDAESLKHEITYSVLGKDQKTQSGIIDAMFREGENWYLVEFKTDEIRDKKRFQWVWDEEDYQDQVEGYLVAAEIILGIRPEPILCFLNYEKRIHLVTDQWQ